jgi:hypothetical protein
MSLHLTRRSAAVALLALLRLAAPAFAQEVPRPLAALSFMAGCWRGDAGVDKHIEEHWTAADSDVMLATTRYLDDNGGRTRAWEFSRIVADSTGIVLFPAPRGNQQGRFRMVADGPGSVRFEDPTHDFPRRILYRRLDARHLAVRIDRDANDREAQEWRLEAVACPVPAP